MFFGPECLFHDLCFHPIITSFYSSVRSLAMPFLLYHTLTQLALFWWSPHLPRALPFPWWPRSPTQESSRFFCCLDPLNPHHQPVLLALLPKPPRLQRFAASSFYVSPQVRAPAFTAWTSQWPPEQPPYFHVCPETGPALQGAREVCQRYKPDHATLQFKTLKWFSAALRIKHLA